MHKRYNWCSDLNILKCTSQERGRMWNNVTQMWENIVAAFHGMHVSPAKQLCMTTKKAWLSDRHTDRQTDAGQSVLAPRIDGSRFLPVLGNSIRNRWSRTLCNLTRGEPLVKFICGVTSENLMVHYFTLMLELKFTEFVILKNKYNS